ncbi:MULTISPECIES: Sec-independent protein translocase subunit TatA [Micrococcaceae]|jgi:sec-independent protein translocase protein TatA|uniref:Sec-independent protein translocase protein TatA n=1 Tax=Pseudarthrobacter equi TaxID=728066 RepID=A0A1H1Z7R2_9MICC|nr:MULTISPECIES: Sec-independent protein translocase subunit TatA [Micrococcaceae]MDQ1055956.1 sec-independent protein translocase protein TatA [Arthrobacter sp. SORGH_AS_0212]MUU73621.1 Sec-independent protein translocase subunit TatA [Pseudarthrobacter sp. GA104]HET7781444.1 Sec-independent protein translocase subunit TatA [Arthrobacter sp.]KQQ85297.1 preprotein translocase subunit TatA [Arthrobacter sp. Leaf137]MBX7443655.1 Sec-independent protein translocase subunit TatA [Arthrobacter sp. 
MGRLFDGPWPIVIIIVVALLLFAAPKLPAMARSLGQSMRIIKSEVKEMKNDGKTESTDASGPVEGTIVNHPKAKPGEPTDGTDVPPSNRA